MTRIGQKNAEKKKMSGDLGQNCMGKERAKGGGRREGRGEGDAWGMGGLGSRMQDAQDEISRVKG